MNSQAIRALPASAAKERPTHASADSNTCKVLVVDDSRVQRKILCSQLARAGLSTIEAASGEEALDICQSVVPDMVISDWMMTGMTGIEFCRAFRALDRESYGYFILLTSKNESAEVALGLDVGADDFLAKPVSGDELRARISAGRRILRMERELTDKNRLLSDTLGELQGLYDSINSDLIEARKLQQSLVRERFRRFGAGDISLLLRPSGHVGGDLVGFFPIGAHRIGIYAIDVSGHGITSALMTARLSGFLSGATPEQNLALVATSDGGFDGQPPVQLARLMNRVVLEELETENYFTMAYADVDLRTGHVAMVQAGHPHPALQRADGSVEYLGQGGLPLGLFEDANYEGFDLILNPGDRLFLMSDGVVEAADTAGRQLGEDGLCQILRNHSMARGSDLLDAMMADLGAFTGGGFDDDISGALFEFHGTKENQPPNPR
jgi:sigma-B regulation protein RsbU (phosphoserine phosphatase)